MSTPVLVLGESGSGKSTSMRNMDADKVCLIQALAKPLPFKSNTWKRFDSETKTGNILITDKTADILEIMNKTRKKIIVIDDFQYTMANEFMRRSDEKGYDKFTEIGRNGWDIMMKAAQLPGDVRVYILSHSITEDSTGHMKMKTIGKMLDDKITPEGMFTMVLKTIPRDNEFFFATRNNGSDPVKTPMGMFDKEMIPNDLQLVDDAICAYYEIPS